MVTPPGTVPEIWDENPQHDFDIRPLADRAIIGRPMSAKVLRYAEHLINKYDTNGNGRLEYDEWYGKMTGSPQVIDLDGDSVLTLDEIATHIEQFSRWRTIHNPYPLQQLIANRVIAEQKRPEGIFQPISQGMASQKLTEKPAIEERPSLSDDVLAETVQTPKVVTDEFGKPVKSTDENADANGDDTTAEDEKEESAPFQGHMPAAKTRKYGAPTQGLPAWFIQRDLNGDGQVSLYEFAAPAFRDEDLAQFGRLDKDADGFITPDELPRQQ